jgi:ABC-2 type transport system ATP-binding protein
MLSAGGIEVENLSKSFRRGRVRALSGVSLQVRRGEAFGVIGPNGAGKTTLMGCLLGFLRPDSGHVAIDGHEPDDLAVRGAMGYLPERLVADRSMSGREFLGFQHGLAGLAAGSRKDDVAAALERVGLGEEAGRRGIKKYSRGMLQRLGLAQALLGSPAYLFLDEPTSALDPSGMMLFRRLIGERKSGGATIILNSHQLREVESICDRVAFVRDGQVEAIQTVEAGREHARVLRVRAAGEFFSTGIAETELSGIAADAGAVLRGLQSPLATFDVADDEGAGRLIRLLVEAGVPVVEAIPEESGLERLFVDEGDSPA